MSRGKARVRKGKIKREIRKRGRQTAECVLPGVGLNRDIHTEPIIDKDKDISIEWQRGTETRESFIECK